MGVAQLGSAKPGHPNLGHPGTTIAGAFHGDGPLWEIHRRWLDRWEGSEVRSTEWKHAMAASLGDFGGLLEGRNRSLPRLH